MASIKAETVVVGAGAMGGWAALQLQEAGAATLLIDAWGAGNVRSSSGGESRIIRCSYGPQSVYCDWAWEALDEWRMRQEMWGMQLLIPCGVLWIGPHQHPHMDSSMKALEEREIPFERLAAPEANSRFPLLRLQDDERAFFEPAAGALLARKACRQVVKAFRRLGGRLLLGEVQPPESLNHDASPRLSCLRLADGREVEAERYLFACGPWMGRLFPKLLGPLLRVTRQEVLFFGPPAGHPSLEPGRLPIWMDWSLDDYYGLPPLRERGLKVANDQLGPELDPSQDERSVAAQSVEKARSYLARRFPDFSRAPLLESRVCQYACTPDRHLIIDRHPVWENAFLSGGGSGHAFKLGPIAGRLAAELILETRPQPPDEVRLDRFAAEPL